MALLQKNTVRTNVRSFPFGRHGCLQTSHLKIPRHEAQTVLLVLSEAVYTRAADHYLTH